MDVRTLIKKVKFNKITQKQKQLNTKRNPIILYVQDETCITLIEWKDPGRQDPQAPQWFL